MKSAIALLATIYVASASASESKVSELEEISYAGYQTANEFMEDYFETIEKLKGRKYERIIKR